MSVSEAIHSVPPRLVKSVIWLNAQGQPDPNGKVPKIADPELADREWAANTDQTRTQTPPIPVLTVVTPRPAPVAAPAHHPDPHPAKPSEQDGSIADAAAREKHWRANLAELKYKKEAGELVPANEVEAAWANTLSQVRTKLLGIPTQFRQALPTLTPPDLVLLENLIREALENLVAADEGDDEDEEPEEEDDEDGE